MSYSLQSNFSNTEKRWAHNAGEALNQEERTHPWPRLWYTDQVALLLSEKVGEDGKILAVDPDQERIKIAQEKHNASNIEYIVGSDKDFPTGQYDNILCFFILHWIKD